MERPSYIINLDMIDMGTVNTSLRLKQGDSGSTIYFKISLNGNAYYDPEYLPEVYFKRPDGSTVFGNTHSGHSGMYRYTLIGNELEIPGKIIADVKFKFGEGRESSASCSIECIADTIGEKVSASSIYYVDAQKTLEELKEITKEAGGIVEEVEKYADEAEGSAQAASGLATVASESAATASGSAATASSSAQAAAGSATAAAESAQAASDLATAAEESAATASGSAAAASSSAQAAAGSAKAAANSETAAAASAATASAAANTAQTAATNAAAAAANAASKTIYGDTTISLGRKAGTTVGANSVAMGVDVAATKARSVAMGKNTTASGSDSVAMGYETTASGHYSFAVGGNTTASGNNSVAIGEYATASGVRSFAGGYYAKALDEQFAIGHYNDETLATAGAYSGTSGTALVIGNGKNQSSGKSNAFRVTYAGEVYAKAAYNSTGADYAEFAEWADGNPDNEDRRGYFVTFDEENPNMIRKANEGEYILGIVSGNPCIIGNADEGWLGKYEFDEFGAIVYEDIEEEVEYIDEETGETKTKLETITTYKLNPEYDPERKYIHRSERPEWDYIGWIGVLSVRDDGTCIPGGYCAVADGGIATAAERGMESYRVLERVNGNIVKVALK